MAHFQYKCLESPSKQIRLVQLLPPQHDVEDSCQSNRVSQLGLSPSSPKTQNAETELIQCTIKEQLLSQLPTYTALSYTWGEPEGSHSILVNDADFRVTGSLETMLRHIRSDTEPMVLWIDQLSINQGDAAEKSEQVPLMRKIYQEASQVIVWLGQSADGSDLVMDILAHVGREAHTFGLTQLTLPELQNWSEESEHDENRRTIKTSLDQLIMRTGPTFPVAAFGKLISRPWFSRVWVVQELSLAKDAVFRCGRKEICYEHFYAAKFFYTIYMWTMLNKVKLSKAVNPGDLQKIFLAQKSTNTSPVTSMLSARRKYQTQSTNMGEPLSLLLKKFHITQTRGTRLQATEAPDMIYGLLGLASDLKDLDIKPDYRKSCTIIYTEVARKLIEQGYVDTLALSQFPKQQPGKETLPLPSWVPGWTGTIHKPCGDLSSMSVPFSASGKSQVSIAETHPTTTSALTISLEGHRVGEVELVGRPWKPSLGGQFSGADANVLLGDVERFCQESARRDGDIYKHPQRRKEAVWRVPIGDKEFNDGGLTFICRATVKSGQGHQALAKKFGVLKPIPQAGMLLRVFYAIFTVFLAIRRFLSLFRRASRTPSGSTSDPLGGLRGPGQISYMAMMGDMQNRRPFMTTQGYVGLGPAGMQPRDIICVLFGAQFPYVLRPAEHGGFTFVGEAYCDGIMDGELMEGNLPKETFKLS